MKTVGDQELALLRDVAETGPSTVGEVAERFGEPRGLARSTVLTMMERLRQKGHLEREQVEGVYRYERWSPRGICCAARCGRSSRRRSRGPYRRSWPT